MGIIGGSLKRPITVVIALLSLMLTAVMAISGMKQDIFPDLKIPAIYIIQGYGGMSPAQMEGYLVSNYELFFLYVPGIEHIESQSIQNVAVIKIYFQPDTDMANAMSIVVAMANRATSLSPKGTLNPFVLRFDAGSLPVGQLVLSSKRSVKELQDLAYTRIRPQLATVPGAEAPPPFGGNIRTIVLNVNADKLRQYNISGDEIVKALASANEVLPSGNVRTGDLLRIAPVNTDLPDIHQLDYFPIRTGAGPQIFVRDIGTVENSEDILAGYALYNGDPTVYLPVVKRADASTVAVVDALRKAMPKMQAVLPPDVKISYEFDQSKYVREAINDVLHEGLMGTILPGLMILLFLKDIRSTAIVVTTIPCSLLASCVGLWLTGQTFNIQTLSGLALAIGILVDEATVTIENVHSHLSRGEPLSRAVYEACVETMVPSFLAMLSVVAVFVPSFFMVGITRYLFIPLSLSVGFAMFASFILSVTLVPVMCVWILKPHHGGSEEGAGGPVAKMREVLGAVVGTLMPLRGLVIPAYLALSVAMIIALYGQIGREMFPDAGSNEFRIRVSAPTGTRPETLLVIVQSMLKEIKAEAGPGNYDSSLGYAGQQPPMFPISSAYLWTSGPHQAVIDIALKEHCKVNMADLKDRLRTRFKSSFPGTHFSFEPGDIVSQIMNLGSPTPISVNVMGHKLIVDRLFAEKIKHEMAKIPYLRDLGWGQPQEYPTCEIQIDRELAGQLGITPQQIGMALQPAYFSSRFVLLSYWRDPESGFSYQVQVQVPQDQIKSKEDLEQFPVMGSPTRQHPLLSDVAKVEYGTTNGEYDRYNMMRMVSLSANISGKDLGTVGRAVQEAVKRAGTPPPGVFPEVKGQVPLLADTFNHLFSGLILAVVVIFLMLSAYFQAPKMVLVVLSTTPAILLGVLISLYVTGTTLNVQSFMGAIMAVGVGVSNSILLVVFAEKNRQEGMTAENAAIQSAESRMRPILMTSIAMVAGMVPMAISTGQSASLGRAVIGGLTMSTLSALTLLPLVFAIIQGRASLASPSLHPEDRGE